MFMAKESYAYLLEDLDVRRWYENVAMGSKVTADVYLRRLGWTCKRLNLKPKDLLVLGDRDLAAALADFVSSLEREGRTGSYIKSWLSFNIRELKAKIKIKGVDDTPTLRDERVPSQSELKKIFMCADIRSRVACVYWHIAVSESKH
jgi:hypothetical protein